MRWPIRRATAARRGRAAPSGTSRRRPSVRSCSRPGLELRPWGRRTCSWQPFYRVPSIAPPRVWFVTAGSAGSPRNGGTPGLTGRIMTIRGSHDVQRDAARASPRAPSRSWTSHPPKIATGSVGTAAEPPDPAGHRFPHDLRRPSAVLRAPHALPSWVWRSTCATAPTARYFRARARTNGPAQRINLKHYTTSTVVKLFTFANLVTSAQLADKIV